MGIIKDCLRHASQIVQDMKRFGGPYSDMKSVHDVMKGVRDISRYEEGWLFGPHRKYDSKTWNDEVLPLIGSTDSYNRKIDEADTAFDRYIGLKRMEKLGDAVDYKSAPMYMCDWIVCGTNYFKCDISVGDRSQPDIYVLDLRSTPAAVRAQTISMVIMFRDIVKWDEEIKYIECAGEGCPEDDSSYEFESLISSMEICYISEGRKDCNSF